MARCVDNFVVLPNGQGYRTVPANCSFCGSQYPTAFELVGDSVAGTDANYVKERILATCEKCAVERLPKLIVEALSIRLRFENDSSGICKQVTRLIDQACNEVRRDMDGD